MNAIALSFSFLGLAPLFTQTPTLPPQAFAKPTNHVMIRIVSPSQSLDLICAWRDLSMHCAGAPPTLLRLEQAEYVRWCDVFYRMWTKPFRVPDSAATFAADYALELPPASSPLLVAGAKYPWKITLQRNASLVLNYYLLVTEDGDVNDVECRYSMFDPVEPVIVKCLPTSLPSNGIVQHGMVDLSKFRGRTVRVYLTIYPSYLYDGRDVGTSREDEYSSPKMDDTDIPSRLE